MQFLAVLAAVALTLSIYCAEDVNKESILELTKHNFFNAVKNNASVFIEFYSPSCRFCKALASEYEKVAKQLLNEKSEIKLAKIDATKERFLAELLGVYRQPATKFLYRGREIDYPGSRQAEDIIVWLKNITGPKNGNQLKMSKN